MEAIAFLIVGLLLIGWVLYAAHRRSNPKFKCPHCGHIDEPTVCPECHSTGRLVFHDGILECSACGNGGGRDICDRCGTPYYLRNARV